MPETTPDRSADSERRDAHRAAMLRLRNASQFVEAWKTRTLVVALVLLGLAHFWLPGTFKLLSALMFLFSGALFATAVLCRGEIVKHDPSAHSLNDKRFILLVIGSLLVIFGLFGIMSLN